MTPDYQRYLELGLPCWSGESGGDADPIFRHEVRAEYDPGVFEQVRFGAVVGWQANARWWLDTAGRLPPGALRASGLLDVEHQAGGHRCNPWFCVGLPVRILPDRVPLAAALCRDHFHSQGGYLSNSGDPYDAHWLTAYKARVRQAGLTVDDDLARRNFMEAVYPLDATDGNFRALLVDPQGVRTRMQPILDAGAPGVPAAIFILAENSD
jgi:hypothetical protein